MGLLKAILDHLKGHPSEYILLLIVSTGLGWQVKAMADFWVNAKIAKEVAIQVAPVQSQMVGLQGDVSAIKQGLGDLISSSKQREILETKTLLCYSPGDARLVRQYEDLQEQYTKLTGHRYEPPGCDVLRKPS
ncbi:MAG: hypothetical protein Q8N51_00950 [Gammaproteobacteria bacterium]|nr:hypothetical protein [Gammaproteobacteria bacterium]